MRYKAHELLEDQRSVDEKRGTRKERGYDANHYRLRKLIMHEQPLCPMCRDEGSLEPAIELHHIDGNPWNLDRTNLIMLCSRCHSKETVLHQGGFGRPPISSN